MRERATRLYWEMVIRAGDFGKREEGQSLVEYAMILAVGSLIILVALKAFGLNLQALYNRMSGQVNGIG